MPPSISLFSLVQSIRTQCESNAYPFGRAKSRVELRMVANNNILSLLTMVACNNILTLEIVRMFEINFAVCRKVTTKVNSAIYILAARVCFAIEQPRQSTNCCELESGRAVVPSQQLVGQLEGRRSCKKLLWLRSLNKA